MFYNIGPRSISPMHPHMERSFTPPRYLTETRGRSYKTFYGCKFRIFIISQIVCFWPAFPAQSIVCGQGQEPNQKKSTCGQCKKLFTDVITSLLAQLSQNHREIHGQWRNYGRKKFIMLATERQAPVLPSNTAILERLARGRILQLITKICNLRP